MNAVAKGLFWVLSPLWVLAGLLTVLAVAGACLVTVGVIAGLFLTGGAGGVALLAGVVLAVAVLWLLS